MTGTTTPSTIPTTTTTPTHRRRHRRRRRWAAVALAAATSFAGALHVEAADSGLDVTEERTIEARSIAEFDGRQIDLATSWEDAEACWVDEFGIATCFASEAEMDRALVAAGKVLAATNPSPSSQAEGARAASCSSSLRLYRNSNYGGSVLYLSQRYYWINLSSYGFDNVVSSYRVGGCSTTFRSGNGGTGSTYGGGTWAWASKPTMSGWDNVLSSVKID